MNFSLLNPLFLIGLLAVAFPIIAHLISRKSGVKKSFSAVSFLLSSPGEKAKRSNLKDFWLLLLRSLILVLIALVFSKPALFSFSSVDVGDVKSVAIVIDNSFSMGYGDNFKEAKSKAKELIEFLPDGSFGAVFPLVPIDSTKSEISEDKNKMKRDLDDLRLSYSFADNERRLEEIFAFLQNAPNEKKEVILFSDSQKNGWRRDDFQREWFIPIDITSSSESENHSVSDVQFAEQRDSIKVQVKVSNSSKNPLRDLLADISLGGKELSGLFNIEPPETGETKDFIFPRNELIQGERLGKVEIPADNLSTDDVRYFVIPKDEELRVIIIDGDPREDSRLSETYYLAEALETIVEIMPLSFSIKDNDAFFNEKLQDYNVIILANVGDISPEKAAELKDFVMSGGSLLIFPGDRVRGNVYNALFQDVLPGEFQSVSEGSYFLAPRDSTIFSDEINQKLSEIEVKKFITIKAFDGSSVLLNVSDSSPFLVERDVREGEIFLFASTADTGWNGFPLSTVFLPVIKKTLEVSHKTESNKRNFIVGDRVKIEFPRELNKMTIKNPDGDLFKIDKENPVFERTLIPGIYRVENSEKLKYSFAVNVDARESDTTKISFENSSQTVPQKEVVKVFSEIWSYFLWGVIALFISESVYRVVSAKS